MMKRLAEQLYPMILAALFSLMTLATIPDVPDVPDAAEPATPGTGPRVLGFAVRFLVARLFWGS
jgi:hypothetical protein